MKPVLVTGAAGFIGARLVESLNRKGTPVISVDVPDFFTSRPEHRSIDFGTIVDFEKLFETLKTPPAAIFHMGACSNTTEFDVAYLERVNVQYSQKLWDYCTAHKIPFIYASSAATYGEGEQGYEDSESTMSQLKPLNPYGCSKLKFDLWALESEKSGHHPPIWSGFKFFNVYGFGERHKKGQASVILSAYDQIKAHGRVKLFKSHRDGIADGHQKRDFVSVEDVVNVMHFAYEKPIKRGIFNLGSGKARTFLDLTRAVFHALKLPEKIEFIDTPIEIRDKYQYFTEAQMQRLLAEGYKKPFTSLERGVEIYLERLKERI